MERVTGIEPAWPAWKAGALPLSYTRVCQPRMAVSTAKSHRWLYLLDSTSIRNVLQNVYPARCLVNSEAVLLKVGSSSLKQIYILSNYLLFFVESGNSSSRNTFFFPELENSRIVIYRVNYIPGVPNPL
jgi:hypothetical protein